MAGHPQPGQGLVPDLPREGAGEEEVVHGLRCLVAEGAERGGAASRGEAVRGATPIEVGEPVE